MLPGRFTPWQKAYWQKLLTEESPVERIATELPEEKLKPWTGNYRMQDGMILKVALDDKALFLELPDEQRFQLHPESENNYFIREFNARIVFSKTSGGKPLKFELIQGADRQVGNYTDPKKFTRLHPLEIFLQVLIFRRSWG